MSVLSFCLKIKFQTRIYLKKIEEKERNIKGLISPVKEYFN